MKTRRIIAAILAVIFFAGLFGFSACRKAEKDYPELIGSIVRINKYGNIIISTSKAEMTENGYEFGDIVTVSFSDKSINVPYCSNYSDVDSGLTGVFGKADDETLTLAVNTGVFASAYGIANMAAKDDGSYEWVYSDGLNDGITFKISMKQKMGYYDQYVIRQLSYTDERSDYPGLSVEDFANFRAVNTHGIKPNTLFRSSSPVDSGWARRAYADGAAKASGVSVIIDLADDEETLTGYEGYYDSCFASAKHIALSMGVNYTGTDFMEKLADGLRFMAENEGVYLIHCKEGKDRTGFVVALLELLMGADYSEAEADYMLTFRNYYGIVKGDEKYDVIASTNFEKILKRTFGVDDVKNADLSRIAEEYIKGLGLTDAQIAALKAHLSDRQG